MARSSKKKSSRAPETRWLERGATRAGMLAVGLVAASALAAWGLVGGYRLVDRRAAAAVTTVDAEIRIEWPPLAGGDGTWLPPSEQRELLKIAQRALGGEASQLSAEPLRRVALALERSGWFASAPRVRREGVAGLHVKGDWRIPVALVRRGMTEYVVSADGYCLPAQYSVDARPRAFPVLLGVADDPPRVESGRVDFQTRWAGADVRAGLALVALLNREEFYHQVAGIDVSAVARGGPVEIVSHRGGRIVWGSPPGTLTQAEPSDRVKVDRLRLLALDTGGIDSGRDRIEIHGPQILLDRSAFVTAP